MHFKFCISPIPPGIVHRINSQRNARGETMDIMKNFELNDDQLDSVVGGVDVGDRVKVNAHVIRYCPGCQKLASVFTGKVVEKLYYEKGGYYFYEVKSDCCGYVERCADYVCSAQ